MGASQASINQAKTRRSCVISLDRIRVWFLRYILLEKEAIRRTR